MNTYYKVANMTDTYGMLALLIVFVAVCCYYRNTFFNIAGLIFKFITMDANEMTNNVTTLRNFFQSSLVNLFTSASHFTKWVKNLRS
jgi:hypothetical protein